MLLYFFASGTSGAAKGVCLSERNLALKITQASWMVGLGENTISLLPFHHAFGLVEGILAAFHYGYEIYLNQSVRTVKRSLAEERPKNLFWYLPMWRLSIGRSGLRRKSREKKRHCTG